MKIFSFLLKIFFVIILKIYLEISRNVTLVRAVYVHEKKKLEVRIEYSNLKGFLISSKNIAKKLLILIVTDRFL